MGKYELLQSYIKKNEDALTMSTEDTVGGDGITVVPTMKAINPIMSHPKISDEVKDELVDVMGKDPALVRLIMTEVNGIIQRITNSVTSGAIRLKRPWENYKLSMVHVAQSTYPNTLDKYLRMYDYSNVITLPWNFKTGLMIHMDFCTFDVMGRTTSTIAACSVWSCYSDKDGEIKVKKDVCILAP